MHGPKPMSEEQVAEFIDDYKNGMMINDMATKYGYASGKSVSAAAIRRFGLVPRFSTRGSREELDVEMFTKMWNSPAYTTSEIAQEFGWADRSSASTTATRLNLGPRPVVTRGRTKRQAMRAVDEQGEEQEDLVVTRRRVQVRGIWKWVEE